MTTAPTFSVVIAAYNASETIVAALNSCFVQTLAPHEIIVVDDGSTDGTAEVIIDHFGSAVKVVRSSRNIGPSGARNRGTSLATGSHWAFLDADDTWHEEKLARVAQVLQMYPKAALVYHDCEVGLQKVTLPAGPPQAKPVSVHKLLLGNCIAVPCAVVKASRLRFDKKMHYLEDWDFFLRAFDKGPVYYLPQTLAFLGRPVLSPGGQSSNRWAMRKGELRGYTKFALAHKLYLPLLPAFWGYSIFKHIRSGLIKS